MKLGITLTTLRDDGAKPDTCPIACAQQAVTRLNVLIRHRDQRSPVLESVNGEGGASQLGTLQPHLVEEGLLLRCEGLERFDASDSWKRIHAFTVHATATRPCLRG